MNTMLFKVVIRNIDHYSIIPFFSQFCKLFNMLFLTFTTSVYSSRYCNWRFIKGVILSSCISGQKCWSVTYTTQNICALKGSTVNISCSYTYPSNHEIKAAFWFTKRESYLGDKESDCTLRITDLRLRDSAGYMFRFIISGEKFSGSPVSLTVTGNLSHISHTVEVRSLHTP